MYSLCVCRLELSIIVVMPSGERSRVSPRFDVDRRKGPGEQGACDTNGLGGFATAALAITIV